MRFLILSLVLAAGFNTYARCAEESPFKVLQNKIDKSGSGTYCGAGNPKNQAEVDMVIDDVAQGLKEKVNAQLLTNVADKVCLIVSEK